jgi:energy-coupling factor transporter ATP-binding protein EcfA2
MHDYFGKTDEDASISFSLNGATRAWTKKDGKWLQERNGFMDIKGFYEGSIIFGNRFRNTNFELLSKLDQINDSILESASDFIRENLGVILHNNKNFYDRLLKLNGFKVRQTVKVNGDIFYYQKGTKRVSQFHMSTGENLLISVLNSINIRNSDRANLKKPCILFLDEIELALHPSSLKRLVHFLKEMSNQYNYAIYFSTHSIELISAISPENIFFLDRHSDNSLLSNKLVHVLPCGGYSNVIELGKEVINSNLVGKTSNISIILDGDVKVEAENYINKNGIKNNIPLNYLPVESLEKYLKKNLCDNVDHKLFRTLNDFIFHQVSLTTIIENYKNTVAVGSDNNGKKLYNLIDNELNARNKSRNEVIEIIVDYLITNKPTQVDKIVDFLKKQFE